MTIKSHLPWPLKAALLAVVLGLGAAVAVWTYDLGRSFAGLGPAPSGEQIAELQSQVAKLQEERDKFSATVNAAESQLNMERSAQKQLAGQVKVLETENVKLKEDLAFFESLLPANQGTQGVAIRRIEVEMIAPNQLKYRLLVMQNGKAARDFVGNLQLVVTSVQAGKSAMIIFPDIKAAEVDKLKLSFRHYQRVEGVLTLPEGTVPQSIQARVLEKGQIRAQQSAKL